MPRTALAELHCTWQWPKIGESVLHVACAAENRDLIEFILDNGALVNITDKQGRSPLMVVAKLGNMSIIDLLLERGSKLDACDINGLSVKDYASREGHFKVVNQLSMQKMSLMARTRSKENVLDDLDQIGKAQVQKKNLNNQKTVVAQITVLETEDKINSNVEDNQNENKDMVFNSTVTNINELEIKNVNVKEVQNEKKNVTIDSKTINADELKVTQLSENNQNENNNIVLNSVLENKINNSSIESNKGVIEKNKLVIELSEDKNIPVNVISIKDEESVSQCTMPPPMDPPKSWDFIQTSIMHKTDVNEKTAKETQENIKHIPDPIICTVTTDDSELEWGSDESLPTDPNQICAVVNEKKDENKNTFYNFITTKLMNKNKKRVSASADSIIDDIAVTTKHVRNKSFTSLRTFKLTVPSDVNKALYQLSPEMNFAHSLFSKSKSFNENITPIKNIDKNSLEFERSKSLSLEIKHNYNSSENQQRDSDSQSDDSLRSKRSLLLSMRMPKVHDEHHDDYHLEVKDSETSEDEGPHYWYSPNKRNDKIVQQDTVIRNNSESEDSKSEEIGLPKSKSTPEGISKEPNLSDNSDTENTISFSTSHEDIYGTHKRTKFSLKRTKSLKAYLKMVTIDKDRLQQETAGYKEITELLKYKLENLKEDISCQNKITKRLEEQLLEIDTKYTEALNRIQTLELSSTNLDKENQYLKQINNELIHKLNNECTPNNTCKPNEMKFKLDDSVGQTDSTHILDSTIIIKKLHEQLKTEQDKRKELDDRVKFLAIEASAHQSCGSTMELLKDLQCKMSKDYVSKKEVLKLKTEQERKISKVKMESEKKLADKFHDLDKLLSQQMDQQEKLEMQREKIESQLKQEFENTRQRFQLEIAKLQTTLKTKEMEEQILRERCEILSQEIEKTQDTKWKTLVDKTYGINNLQKSSPEMIATYCKTPEQSPTFEKTELAESSMSKYQYNVQTLRNELDKVIIQSKNAALEEDKLDDE